jgi:hypothetical protein
MCGHLSPYVGKFSQLQHLHLRTFGQHSCCESTVFSYDDRMEERYMELASFIDSVKPTLQHLILDFCVKPEENHGGNHNHLMGKYCWRGWASLGMERPVDTTFAECILPVLETGPWPRLKTLVVRGLGGNPKAEDGGEFSAVERRLQSSLNEAICLTLKRYVLSSN